MNGESPNLLLGQLLQQLRGGGGGLEELYPLLRGLFVLAQGETPDGAAGRSSFFDLLSGQAAQRAGVDPAALREALVAALGEGRPQALLNDENVRAAVVFGARRALAANGIDASEDDVRNAVRLLLSGQAMRDVADVGDILLGAGQSWPQAVVRDLLDLPKTIRTLVSGVLVTDVLGDLRTAVGTAARIQDILQGDFDDPVRSQALNRLYGQSAAVRGVVGTSNELLHNETVVLALVIYANMHGARIDGDMVEVVRDSLLAADEATLAEGGPNLGPLLLAGAKYARERYGHRAPEMLRGLIGV